MGPRKVLLTLLGLVAGLIFGSSPAEATWPTGAIRTVSGQWCTFESPSYICPYVSDSADYYGANCNTIYADYFEDHFTGDSITVSACRQSWTGSAAACGTAGSSSSYGDQDTYTQGFSYIAGAASSYDYFYVALTPVGADGGDAIETVWGAGFSG